MGAYCLALPIVELPYAMMIVYAHLFKCVEPILTIVSTLNIGDPCKNDRKEKEIVDVVRLCLVQSSISDHRSLFDIKQKFSSNIDSDHYVFFELFEVNSFFFFC